LGLRLQALFELARATQLRGDESLCALCFVLRYCKGMSRKGLLSRVPSIRSIKTSDLSKAISSEDWENATRILSVKPETVKTWNGRPGFFEGIKHSEVLPIHEACANGGTPLELVKALVKAYPEGLKQKETAYHRLPIHIACRKNANINVVRLLMEVFPDGSLVPDSLGRLPLHYALSNGANDFVVQLLLEIRPGAAMGTDKRGWLPLHVACSVGASTNVIELIARAYPEGTIIKTSRGTSAERCMDSHKASNKEEVYEVLSRYRKAVEAKHRPVSQVTSEKVIV